MNTKILVLVLACAIIFLSIGYIAGTRNTETIVVRVHTERVNTITETTTVYPEQFKRFGSYEELRDWLRSVHSEIWLDYEPDWKCRDFSWWLIERAQRDGYLMVFHGIRAEAYNSCFTNLRLDGAHGITATYINGHTYIIEPRNFEVFPSFNIE